MSQSYAVVRVGGRKPDQILLAHDFEAFSVTISNETQDFFFHLLINIIYNLFKNSFLHFVHVRLTA